MFGFYAELFGYLPTIAKHHRKARIMGFETNGWWRIMVQSVWRYSESTTSHEKCNKTHMEYPPSHIGVILRTLTCSVSTPNYLDKNWLCTHHREARVMGFETNGWWRIVIHSVWRYSKSTTSHEKCNKMHMEYPPSHIGVILRTLTCAGYYAELSGRKLVMYPTSRGSDYGLQNEWLVANHGLISLAIFKKYDFTWKM